MVFLPGIVLKRMMDLKKDMCHLQKHTKRNRDADVQEKVKSLPGDLVYASRYWARHFAKSKRDNNSLLELLHEVCVRAPLTLDRNLMPSWWPV